MIAAPSIIGGKARRSPAQLEMRPMNHGFASANLRDHDRTQLAASFDAIVWSAWATARAARFIIFFVVRKRADINQLTRRHPVIK
jgi:hypothetical protein